LGKYDRARQATDDIIQRMRIGCWICKATDTYLEYAILIVFPQQSGYSYAVSVTFARTLLVLLTEKYNFSRL